MTTLNLDALLKTPERTHGKCLVMETVEQLPEKYKTAVEDMINNPDISSAFIAARFKEAGIRGSADVIRRHRRNVCPCHTIL